MACQPCVTGVVKVVTSITVEPVMCLFMFASFLTFTAFMAMTYDKSCLADYNQTMCDELNDNKSFAESHSTEQDVVQSSSSYWMMMSNVALVVPATAVLLFFLGTLGDRKGRRLPIAIPCMAAVAYSASNIVNAKFMSWSPGYTLFGPVLSGLGGSYLALLAGCYTYLTHRNNPERRMAAVGIAEAAVFISSTVSVFVSGRLVNALGYVSTFAIPMAFQAICLIYVWLVLPEVKPREATSATTPTTTTSSTATNTGSNTNINTSTDTPVTNSTTNLALTKEKAGCCQGVCLSPLRDMWTFIMTPRPQQVKVHLMLFILVLDILQLCTTGENYILMLYLKRSPRNWTYTRYGYFKGAENFTRGAAVLVLLPLLKKLLAPRDTTLILAGLVSKTAGLILLSLAKETWTIFLVVGVASLQGFPSAGLRSLMASLVHDEEQGRLFGLTAATEGVVSLLSTLLFNGVYPLTLSLYDGLCFQVMAFLVFVCFLIVLGLHIDVKRTEEYTVTRLPEQEETTSTDDANVFYQTFDNPVSTGSVDSSLNTDARM